MAPGFYDGALVPQYAYVSPPPLLAATNVMPATGLGRLAVGATGQVAGGTINTRDQPIAQAGITIAAGSLAAPLGGGPVELGIKPYAIPQHPSGITLEGNVYCITANTTFSLGRKADVTLFMPPTEPTPTSIYRAPDLHGLWVVVGSQIDFLLFLMTASTDRFGCFAVGYPTPHPSGGLRLGGSILPVVTAALIVIVLIAGFPLALLRRRRGPRDSGSQDEG